jgi:ABC-type xylose transport system permease subunit
LGIEESYRQVVKGLVLLAAAAFGLVAKCRAEAK